MCGTCLKSISFYSPLFCIFLSAAGLQTAPEGAFASADALLSRLAHPASLCGALGYLEPDLAEKNPPVFAQKLQVCSSHVTFLEFVKTSVENEPLSQIEAILGMFQTKSFPLRNWYMCVLYPGRRNYKNCVITYWTGCFYFYWELDPSSHFPDVSMAPETVFIYDLFTKAEVSGQARLFKYIRQSQIPTGITSGLSFTPGTEWLSPRRKSGRSHDHPLPQEVRRT